MVGGSYIERNIKAAAVKRAHCLDRVFARLES